MGKGLKQFKQPILKLLYFASIGRLIVPAREIQRQLNVEGLSISLNKLKTYLRALEMQHLVDYIVKYNSIKACNVTLWKITDKGIGEVILK